jgi:hypothetical protein
MRVKGERRHGLNIIYRWIILGSRLVLITQYLCVTSLGRLTRATERPIFGHEARNNDEKNTIVVGKEPQDRCRTRNSSFVSIFQRSFCCAVHANNVESSAAPTSADSDPHAETKFFDVFNGTVLVVV